jgi:hypothetical protein
MRIRSLALSLIVGLSWSVLPSHAGYLMDVAVIDLDSGRPLQVHRHYQRLYVVGTPGMKYGLQLKNHSARRVKAVISVDGLNALTGDVAASEQSGYVLNPGQLSRIDGWRKSTSEVAQFVFTDSSISYAGRTGRPRNIGVIGVAVFPERDPIPVSKRVDQAQTIESGGASNSKAAESSKPQLSSARGAQISSLGTGHGERVHSPTQYTEFQAASSKPAEILSVYYDRLEVLVAKGIVPQPRVEPTLPIANPFPGDQFVPDPPK